MHTTRLSSGRVFLHDGDFSGDLLINCVPDEVEQLPVVPGEAPVIRVSIPFDDIKELVSRYVRGELIGALEAADADEVLLGRVGTRRPEEALR